MTERLDTGAPVPPEHGHEPHAAGLAGRLNWLRAGVLGANDGIVSVAGIVVGVAGATPARGPVFTAGLAGLVAGAVSMALGEYVSVSSQRDSEQALLAKEKAELRDMPESELDELAGIYERKGLRPQTARQVAIELTEHDAPPARRGRARTSTTRPARAGRAGLGGGVVAGAILPLVAILPPPCRCGLSRSRRRCSRWRSPVRSRPDGGRDQAVAGRHRRREGRADLGSATCSGPHRLTGPGRPAWQDRPGERRRWSGGSAPATR